MKWHEKFWPPLIDMTPAVSTPRPATAVSTPWLGLFNSFLPVNRFTNVLVPNVTNEIHRNPPFG